MFGGDVVLTWRPANIVSIMLMAIVAGAVVVAVTQAIKHLSGGDGQSN